MVQISIKDRGHLGTLLFANGGRQPHRLDCDVLINCTGLHGARALFNDDTVYPIRGQVGAHTVTTICLTACSMPWRQLSVFGRPSADAGVTNSHIAEGSSYV